MSLSLKINIVDHNVTKTIVFDPTTTVHDACRIIREKCAEADGQGKFKHVSFSKLRQSKGVILKFYCKLNSNTFIMDFCYIKSLIKIE